MITYPAYESASGAADLTDELMDRALLGAFGDVAATNYLQALTFAQAGVAGGQQSYVQTSNTYSTHLPYS
jgi:hypothetical protein